MKVVWAITVFLLLLGCDRPPDKSEYSSKMHAKEYKPNPLTWQGIRTKFPYKEVKEFNFSADGAPINPVDNLPEVEGEVLEVIKKRIPQMRSWEEYSKIYYYSLNRVNEREQGVFLTITEFDGLRYTFDLLDLDENLELKGVTLLGESWEAAECYGFQRGWIRDSDQTLLREKILKCVDEEQGRRVTEDSTRTRIPLAGRDLNSQELQP